MNEKEFRQLVVPLGNKMYACAIRSGLPSDDAADIVQEALLRLWRAREGIPKDEAGSKAYCFVSFRNLCISHYQRKKDTIPLESVAGLRAGPDNDSVEMNDTQRNIIRLIEKLPDNQRTVIKMSSFGGFEISEIAEATGFTAVNVRKLLSRARKALREMIIDKRF